MYYDSNINFYLIYLKFFDQYIKKNLPNFLSSNNYGYIKNIIIFILNLLS